MNFRPLEIKGAWLIESQLWNDERGLFQEWFKHEEVLSNTGINFSVQQANISISKKGVIRGIHYSLAPGGQAKWVSCAHGSIIDVIVDIRPNSPTYKKIEYIHMKATDGKAILIGEGLGHGFVSLEETSAVTYLLNSPYMPNLEYEINPNDPELAINWDHIGNAGTEKLISKKDSNAPTLEQRRLDNLLPLQNKVMTSTYKLS